MGPHRFTRSSLFHCWLVAVRDCGSIDGRTQTSIVDQGIDLTKVGDGALNHLVTLALIANIGLVHLGLDTLCFRKRNHFTSSRFIACEIHRNVGAFFCEALNNGSPDASTAPGYKRSPPF